MICDGYEMNLETKPHIIIGFIDFGHKYKKDLETKPLQYYCFFDAENNDNLYFFSEKLIRNNF